MRRGGECLVRMSVGVEGLSGTSQQAIGTSDGVVRVCWTW